MSGESSFQVGGAQPIDLGFLLASPLTTAFPSVGATDGARRRYVALASATGRQIDLEWDFSYSARAGYWYLKGGSPITNYNINADATASTAYATPGSVHEVTMPLDGDYLVAIHSDISNWGGAGFGGAISYAVGGVGASDDWSVFTFKLDTGARFGRPLSVRIGAAVGMPGEQLLLLAQAAPSMISARSAFPTASCSSPRT